MFRDIKRDAFHRSHPLVPAMNASTTPVSCLIPPLACRPLPRRLPPKSGTRKREREIDRDRSGLLDQDHPRMVIRQIYSLASATTTITVNTAYTSLVP